MRNVAIVGQFCAGKTTLAKELADTHGYRVVSMAANLKAVFAEVYGTLDKSKDIVVTRRTGEEVLISVRKGLQEFGESVKSMDRDFWLKWFLRDTDYMHTPLVMDDARLFFEVDALRGLGWAIVKIETPEYVRNERFVSLYGRSATPSEASHPTETEVPLITADLTLDGTSAVEDMADTVMEFCHAMPELR